MSKTYNAKEAIQKALNETLRYERVDYCRRCEKLHTEPAHLGSLSPIADEVYLWLGFGEEKQNLRFYTRIMKTLEDAPVTGEREKDIEAISELLFNDYALSRG